MRKYKNTNKKIKIKMQSTKKLTRKYLSLLKTLASHALIIEKLAHTIVITDFFVRI